MHGQFIIFQSVIHSIYEYVGRDNLLCDCNTQYLLHHIIEMLSLSGFNSFIYIYDLCAPR